MGRTFGDPARRPRSARRSSGGFVRRLTRPVRHLARRLRPAEREPRGHRGLIGTGIAVVLVAGAGAGWIAYRSGDARTAVADLQRDAGQLQDQLARYDLAAAGPTLARVRGDSARAHRITGDPVWRTAGLVPVLGRRLHAATATSTTLADITQQAQPLEAALPALDPRRSAGGVGVDTAALTTLADTLPDLSAAVSAGALRMDGVDAGALPAAEGSGVRRLQQALASARRPLAGSVPMMRMLPAMLGADRARTWMVLLQQDAEARGTGGLVGAFAVLQTDRGQVRLVDAQPRGWLDRGPAIPDTAVPDGLRDLWGKDLTEWAGLNLSPNFPWTGQLVASGWKARGGGLPPLDYVSAIDPHAVAALIAATGPVRVRGLTVTSANAVPFLSTKIYRTWKDPNQVDAVVTDLVKQVFTRFSSGRFELPKLVDALKEPVDQGRMLLWAADRQQQTQLAAHRIAGQLPQDAGAFAMAVVNNGGGNKLDAYLKVHTDYHPTFCAGGSRLGWITVTLDNTAPSRGLPDYVTVRSDLLHDPELFAKAEPGSNRVLLDVYGPVAGQAATTLLDGRPVTPISGEDGNHPVWRVEVPIDPGQRRQVSVYTMAQAVDGDSGTRPVVVRQPMVQPVTTSSEPLPTCRS